MRIRKRTLMGWGIAVAAVALLARAWGLGDGPRPASAQGEEGDIVVLEEGLAPVEAGFADANGARLYYEVYGEGEPLLLIPGLAFNHLLFADRVPVYAREFKVIVFDPRGTGQSSSPEGVESSMALMADAAAALLDALGVDAAHMWGVSLGGMVAQEMALRHPAKIRSLSLGSTTPGGPQSVPAETWAVVALVAYTEQGITAPNFLEALFSPGYLAEHGSELFEGYQRFADYPQTTSEAYAAHLGAVSRHDTYDRVPEIVAPTLVIHGTDDPLLPAANGRILAERIPGAELVLLEGIRHAALIEKGAEVDAVVLGFLRRHAGQVPAPAIAPTTGSGGLLAEDGSGIRNWWYALAVGGALLVVAGLAGLRTARRRR